MTEFIKQFWEKQGEIFKESHEASWGDNFAIDLEIENISKFINEGDNVLDVGCANGYSTFFYLKKKPSHITGVDFADNMIQNAKIAAKKFNVENIVKFEIGDIKNLDYPDSTFDLSYTTRVLINLPNWVEQKLGIDELIRVTKKGGKIIISEAFYEPLVLLNSLRQLVKLPPLVEHDFNRYLKKTKVENYLKNKGYNFECIDMSSIYYLGSRFLRELVTNPSDYTGYSNPINKLFYNIEKEYSGGGFGIQQIYLVYK